MKGHTKDNLCSVTSLASSLERASRVIGAMIGISAGPTRSRCRGWDRWPYASQTLAQSHHLDERIRQCVAPSRSSMRCRPDVRRPRPARRAPTGNAARGRSRPVMVPRLATKDDPTTRLSDTQSITLSAAAQRPDGNVLPLPGLLRGGAANKVVAALLSRDLVRASGERVCREVGGGKGTGVEQSLGRKPLKLNASRFRGSIAASRLRAAGSHIMTPHSAVLGSSDVPQIGNPGDGKN